MSTDSEQVQYEIFNRLNTGGTNLKPQEIRSSLYHSKFYKILYKLNSLQSWRRLQKTREPDLHMKDVEVLLRAIALLQNRHEYKPPMTKFLNDFSGFSVRNPRKNDFILNLMTKFLEACDKLPHDIFLSRKTRSKNFNVALFESVVCGVLGDLFKKNSIEEVSLSARKINKIADTEKFQLLLQEGTTKRSNLLDRIKLAENVLGQ